MGQQLETLGSILVSTFSVIQIVKWFAEYRREKEIARKQKLSELVWQVFPKEKGKYHLIEGKSTKYVPREERDPEDSDAASAAADIILGPRQAEMQLRTVDLINIECNANHYLSGSVPSNQYTRNLLGYDSKNIKQPPRAQVSLFIDYDVPMGDCAKRYFRGGEHVAGNWRVRSKTDRNVSFEIKQDRKGFQKNDYLLLSKLPNWLSDDPFAFSSVTIQGVHGVGTLAFKEVLRNPDILEEIIRGKKGAQYWQSLIEVTRIKHETPQSKPEKIAHIDTVPLMLH